VNRKRQIYDFKPPVSQWDTDHLIFIANGQFSIWEEDAIRQAREELTKRGVAPEYEQTVLDDADKSDKYGERLLELGEKNMDAYALEDYTLAEKIAIVVCTPVILLRPWAWWLRRSGIGTSLSELKGSGYKTKYRARLRLLLLGVVVWTAPFLLIGAINRYNEENRRQKYPDPQYIKRVYPSPDGPVIK
jgi:hypothetical protein